MNKVKGKIEEISDVNHNGNLKKIVRLLLDNGQIAFFEFQGRAMNKLISFNINDKVRLFFVFNGKQSCKDVHYNNLIGREIYKLS